jgi:hypothetical protein
MFRKPETDFWDGQNNISPWIGLPGTWTIGSGPWIFANLPLQAERRGAPPPTARAIQACQAAGLRLVADLPAFNTTKVDFPPRKKQILYVCRAANPKGTLPPKYKKHHSAGINTSHLQSTCTYCTMLRGSATIFLRGILHGSAFEKRPRRKKSLK